MGAGASIESDGCLYHARSCGCIYRCEYRNTLVSGDVELVKCCYHCLEKLRQHTFDYEMVDDLCRETRNQPIDVLTTKSNMQWMNQVSALAYADKRGIRSVEEFLYNKNILCKYGFDHRK